MYYFEATYFNMDTNENITRKIQLDGQFFGNEKEIYIRAMTMAYEMMNSNECMEKVKFLAC